METDTIYKDLINVSVRAKNILLLSGSRKFDYVPDGEGNLNRKYIRLNRKCPFVRFPGAKTENGGSYSIFRRF